MFKKDQEQGIKYCPNLEIDLPIYHHIEYKPRYSAKPNKIFKLDTDTVQTQCGNMHIKPDRTGKENVLQPGGGDGHDNCQAVRRGEGGMSVGTGDGIARKDVNILISSWEQLNAGGGGGGMSLKIPTGMEGKEKRRQSQEFRNLCGQFDGKERGGVETDVSGMPGRDTSRGLECSFASLSGTGTSPGPRKGRGAQRKLSFTQTKLSFEVIRESSGLNFNQSEER